jgi:hypothetical protein
VGNLLEATAFLSINECGISLEEVAISIANMRLTILHIFMHAIFASECDFAPVKITLPHWKTKPVTDEAAAAILHRMIME